MILTTFLHSGFSEVSVSFLFISASSSGVSLTAWLCSSPQKHITAFLHRPGSSLGSVEEEMKVMKMFWGCGHCITPRPGLCTIPSMTKESESCWLLTQTSCSRSSLSSVRCLRLQTSRYNCKMKAHRNVSPSLRARRAWRHQ